MLAESFQEVTRTGEHAGVSYTVVLLMSNRYLYLTFIFFLTVFFFCLTSSRQKVAVMFVQVVLFIT